MRKFIQRHYWALVLAALGLVAFSGRLPSIVISIGILGISFALVFTDRFFLLFPVLLFYYEILGKFLGMSVYRYYSFAFLAGVFIYYRHTMLYMKRSLFPVISLLLIYTVAVIFQYNIRMGVFNFLDIMLMVYLADILQQEPEKLKEFFTVYVLVALLSFSTSMFLGLGEEMPDVVNGQYVVFKRLQGTFEDPNYMGFFYTIAVFATVILKLFKKPVRIAAVVVLYAMIFSTLSMTAIVGNVVLWIIYLLFIQKITCKTIFLGAIAFLGALFLYQYGLSLGAEGGVLGQLCFRIQGKVDQFLIGDMIGATTNRTLLTSLHWKFFKEQSFLRKLFGGYLCNPIGVDLPAMKKIVAHNEYVDLLLNVGILGEMLILGWIAIRSFKLFLKVLSSRKEVPMFVLLVKFIWFYYAATLTIFTDFRFLLFYLL